MPQALKQELNFTLYASVSELTAQEANLVKRAQQACKTSYSPYSNFRVGAALLLVNGEIVAGSNQENAAYPSGLCAERVAVFAAASQYPGQAILAIAIAAYKAEGENFLPVTPCGSCRQVLLEYEYKQGTAMEVLLPYANQQILKSPSVSQLLPLCFNPESL